MLTAAQPLVGGQPSHKIRSEPSVALFCGFLSKGRCGLSTEVLAFGVLLGRKDQEKMPKYSADVFPEL